MSFEKSPCFVLDLSESDVTAGERHFYEFKAFRLNVAERQLLHRNSPVPLTPKAFDVLTLLVERNGHLVRKDELLESVWAESFVEEQNITRIIHTLRRSLGENDNGDKFIETVARKGYRFVADVTEVRDRQEPKQENGSGKAGVAGIGRLDQGSFEMEIGVEPERLAPSYSSHVASPQPAEPRHRARIILFTIGFLTAMSLLVHRCPADQADQRRTARRGIRDGHRRVADQHARPDERFNRSAA
jgi:DNA-binding winged helix-turn-helix (wHTH) protein